ncbi:MAG: hypothetical protein SF187_04490 [Deltaproteobacteria bacterium]|nr:hypothetical protein [Deltaproteobacteria bacterium]
MAQHTGRLQAATPGSTSSTLARVFDQIAALPRQSLDSLFAEAGMHGWQLVAKPNARISVEQIGPHDLVVHRAIGEGRMAFAQRFSELTEAWHVFGPGGTIRNDVVILRQPPLEAEPVYEAEMPADSFESISGCADEYESEFLPLETPAIETLGGEMFEVDLPLERPTRPALSQSDVRWAPVADSPDHRHLLPETFSATAFALTPTHLESLCRLNRFDLPTEATRILFALRACTLQGEGASSGWAASVSLVEATPDHQHARCVLGVWDRPGGRVNVFRGSTVPFWRSMENFRQGGEHCNMLATGLYEYRVGTHRSGHRLEIKGALRQRGPVVVVRTLDDLVYEASDTWESGDVGDNIHPARQNDTNGFSSEGCHTIPGTYDRETGTHAGAWIDFREAMGLTRTTAPAQENGRAFTLVLLTGRDARLVAQATAAPASLTRLRFGSRGPDVASLQMGLAATGHLLRGTPSLMDATTTLAYVRWQQSVDSGRADAIVTPDDARALGFDLISGRSIKPVPWRRGGASTLLDLLRPTPTPAPAAAPTAAFTLSGSVGRGGANAAADVAALKNRLIALGYNWVRPGNTIDDDTIAAIKLFQSIIAGSNDLVGDGLIEVPGRPNKAYQWLQARNAPRWQTMPAGSRAEGFVNVELADLVDQHDFGTDWLAGVIRAAAAHYRDNYLRLHPTAALLTVNDVSLPRGGDTPDHGGHECGLACDLRLPRTDGTAPGNTTFNTATFDRDATRGMLEALWAQPLVSRVYFNDAVLIGEGLCAQARGHDDHVHFQINAPARIA